MDDIRKSDAQDNITSHDTFAWQSCDEKDDSGTSFTLSLDEASMSSPSEPEHEETTDEEEIEQLDRTSRLVESEPCTGEVSWIDKPISSYCPDTLETQRNENNFDTVEDLKLSIVQSSMPLPSELGKEEITYVLEMDRIEKSFKKERVELERSIPLPSFAEINKNIQRKICVKSEDHQSHQNIFHTLDSNWQSNSTNSGTFQPLPYEDSNHPGQDLRYSHIQTSISQHHEPGNKEMTDAEKIQLPTALLQNSEQLEPYADDLSSIDTDFRSSISLPTFELPLDENSIDLENELELLQSLDHQSMSTHSELRFDEMIKPDELENFLKGIEEKNVEADPGMDNMLRFDTQGINTSQDTIGPESYDNTVDSGQELKRDDFSGPADQLPSHSVVDTDDAEIPQQPLQRPAEQQSQKEQHQNKESSKPTPILLSQSLIPMKESKLFIKTQNLSSQMENPEKSSMCHVSRGFIQRTTQPAFGLPKDLLSSQTVAHSHDASERTEKQPYQQTEQLPYQQQLRFQENSDSASLTNELLQTGVQKELSKMDPVNRSIPRPLEPVTEDMEEKEELQLFIKIFTLSRIDLGMSHTDVSFAISKLQGEKVTDISSFENSSLSPENMRNHKSLLQRWLKCINTPNRRRTRQQAMADTSSTPGHSEPRRRVVGIAKESLEKVFLENPEPTDRSMDMLSESFNLTKKAVENWFQNRRLKEKREKPSPGCSKLNSPPVTTPCKSSPVLFTMESSATTLNVSSPSTILQHTSLPTSKAQQPTSQASEKNPCIDGNCATHSIPWPSNYWRRDFY